MFVGFHLARVLLALAFLVLTESKLAEKAVPLIEVTKHPEDGQPQFVLNQEAISLVEKHSLSLKVISAIGDARVGKSTTLNFIQNTLQNEGSSNFNSKFKMPDEVFQTGNSIEAVTRGVWLSTFKGISGTDYVLLDVEGTDLGDDLVTEKLSFFTALLSSTLTVFMKETPSSQIIDFLHKICRLSELSFGKVDTEFFPRLIPVVRGNLAPPAGHSNIDDYIRDALTKPTWKDNSDEKKTAIKKRFPEKNIDVLSLPYISDREYLKSPKYVDRITALTLKLEISQEKKTLSGAAMDGKTLADLAKRMVNVMNNKTLWDALDTGFYQSFEDNVCRKAFETDIAFLLVIRNKTAKEMEEQKDEAMKHFTIRCKVKYWVDKAEKGLRKALKNQTDFENKNTLKWNIAKAVVSAAAVIAAAAGAAAGVAAVVAAGVAAGVAVLDRVLSDVKLKDNAGAVPAF